MVGLPIYVKVRSRSGISEGVGPVSLFSCAVVRMSGYPVVLFFCVRAASFLYGSRGNCILVLIARVGLSSSLLLRSGELQSHFFFGTEKGEWEMGRFLHGESARRMEMRF